MSFLGCFLVAVAFATRTLFRFGGAGAGVAVGLAEVWLLDVFAASEASLGGISLLCLGLLRRDSGDRGFGAGCVNDLRSAVKKFSKGPASATSIALKGVKIDKQRTIVWSGRFIKVTDTACIW